MDALHPFWIYICRKPHVDGKSRCNESRRTILQLAQEIAQSGRYRGWRTIEAHLRADGLIRVREVPDDPDVRRELDDHWATARASALPVSS